MKPALVVWIMGTILTATWLLSWFIAAFIRNDGACVGLGVGGGFVLALAFGIIGAALEESR